MSESTTRAGQHILTLYDRGLLNHRSTSAEALKDYVVMAEREAVEQALSAPPGCRPVWVSEGLFEALGGGRVDWGEPDGHGFYSPVIYEAEVEDSTEIAARHKLPWVAEHWGMDAVIRRNDGSRIVVGDAEYHPDNLKTAQWIVDLTAALDAAEAREALPPTSPGVLQQPERRYLEEMQTQFSILVGSLKDEHLREHAQLGLDAADAALGQSHE